MLSKVFKHTCENICYHACHLLQAKVEVRTCLLCRKSDFDELVTVTLQVGPGWLVTAASSSLGAGFLKPSSRQEGNFEWTVSLLLVYCPRSLKAQIFGPIFGDFPFFSDQHGSSAFSSSPYLSFRRRMAATEPEVFRSASIYAWKVFTTSQVLKYFDSAALTQFYALQTSSCANLNIQ